MLKMRRATENQGDTRALTEYYSPGSKVKDLVFQPHSRSHFAPFAQETPMKPSQLPNRLSHPPPRRMLPLQSPELCHTDRQPQHPHHFTGPVHSSGFVPNSSTNVGSQVTVCHPMERDRLQHQQRQTPGFFHSQWSAPFRPMKSCTAPSMPQSVSPFLPSSHQLMRDLSNQSPSFPIRKDQGTESKSTSSHTGSKNVTAEGKVSNKEDQSGVKSSLQTIQLHRPPVTTSVYPRGGQEGCSLPLVNENGRPENSSLPSRYYLPSQCTQSSDKSSGLLVLHKPAAHCQDQPHKKTPHISVECESRKRHREFEGCDDSPKKQCVPGINSGTAKSTDGNSMLPQPSSSSSSVLEPSAKTPNGHLCTEPACGRSDVPDQSSCTSLKLCPKKRPSMGAKQAFMKFNQSDTLTLSEVKSSSKDRSEDSLKKRSNSHNNRDKSSSFLSSEVPQKDNMTTPHVHLSGHPHRSTSVSPVSTLCRGGPTEESRRSDTSKSGLKSNAGSSGFRAAERHKTTRSRRSAVIPNDIEELFTPDRKTYVVCSSDKAAKSNTDGHKSATLEKSCVSNSVTCSGATITESSCHKTASPYTVRSEVSSSLSAHHPQVTMPNVILERVNLKDFKFRRLTNYPDTSSGRQLKDERVKSEERRTALLQNNVRPSALETTTTTSCSSSLTERRRSETDRKLVNEEDPIDVELDLGLSFAVDLDLTQSSHSSEDEQLISLQEMMERVAKPPPGTPEKGAFSAPSTPGHRNCQSKTEPLQTSKNSGIYKNSLDQMLKEINTNKRAKEVETQLLTACKEDLLRIAEYEEAEENRDEGISTEQQEFLRRYSLMCNAIKEVPPGEAVFNLEKFGRLFNHNTLQLRHCMITPQGTAQKTLLWLPSGQTTFLGPPLERSSPAQLKLHLNIGLFQDAYSCPLPCPDQVTCFLFKMMSVHSERMVSEKILQALCDIACSSASQAVKSGSQQFKVWVPTLSDVTLVLMNMGVAFVTLFPFESLQPPFTEGDLLENISIKSESPSNNEDQRTFPEHNCNCVLKYLSYCIGLCPRAYSDDHLLLLLTVVGKISLDTQVILQSSMDLNPLLYKIVNNIRDWDTVLPRICRALTDLTDDHHNMCMLAQLLPDSTRGKQLRRHLSLSMISKLLDGKCTYRPSENDFQLRELRPYLPRMQPSTLLRNMLSSSSRSQVDQEEDMAALDQQSYYLCYSLLTLANEASNFQFFPAHQKEELLSLSTELETHIKCDIRESEKCLYRSKVKDLVARMYTKWQMLLQRTRPLNGKLYDYWQPSQLEALTSSQEEQEMDISNDGEGAVMEEDGEEDTSETEEILMTIEDKEKGEEDKPIDYMTERDMKPEEMEEDVAMDDTKEPKEETEAVIQVHSQIKAGGSD